MVRKAPAVPESWAAQREENRERREAAPALAPAREEDLVRGRYKIVSRKGVFGHECGETVELALPKGALDALIEAGHIVLALNRAEKPVAKED